MSRPRILLFLVCVCAFLIFGPVQSRASGQSIGITPALVEATVKRGATYNKAYTVSNNTGARLRLRFSVADYWYNESNNHIDGRPGTLPRSASLWVQFVPAEAVVGPHGSVTVTAIITIPMEAAGGYYTSPIIDAEEADSPAKEVPGKNMATASVAIHFSGLMMLTTEDATEYNVEVMGGSISPPTSSTSLEMQLDVRNRGTSHARLRGAFAILNARGGLAGRGKIDETRYLPGQRYILKAPWGGELSPGLYTTVVTLTYDRAGAAPATVVYEIPFEVK